MFFPMVDTPCCGAEATRAAIEVCCGRGDSALGSAEFWGDKGLAFHIVIASGTVALFIDIAPLRAGTGADSAWRIWAFGVKVHGLQFKGEKSI